MTTATENACWACCAPARASEDYAAAGLLRCPVCELLFDPRRGAQELRDLYDESYFEDYGDVASYTGEAGHRRRESARRVRWLRRHGARGRLLEIGAAAGYFLEAARTAGFEVVGVEPSEAMARRGRERAGLDIRAGFIEDADLPAASFDVVAAWHVLEHIADPVGALRRLRDALRPGGLLFAEVPNVQGHNARAEKLDWKPLELRHHVAHYGPESLRRLLERAGFEVVKTSTYEFSAYNSLRQHLHPHMVLFHHVLTSVRKRAPTFLPHPQRHDLLRAVARVPTTRA